MGSYERFIGILLEHLGGELPVWLAPTQTVVLPISDRHAEYAHRVVRELREAGARAAVDDRTESVAKKVRDARRKTPDSEIERIAERLGGRVDRLKGRARKRFRESLRKEMADVQDEQRGPKEALWGAGMAAITAAATTLAQRFAGRLAGDEEEGRLR